VSETLTVRIAVLSDIHANLVALDSVLAAIGSVDAVWHLGDVVGYGPEPDGVVARLRDGNAVGVRGNHDAAAVGGSEIDYFNADAKRAMEWTRKAIGSDTRAWLAALPERRAEGDFSLVHGSPRDPTWEYVTNAAVARRNLEVLQTTYCLHGHTHLPSVFRDEGGAGEAGVDVETLRPSAGSGLVLDGRRVMANPGSVGQPRDGDPRASCLVLDVERAELTWHRVPYDIAATQAAMRRLKLPDRLIGRLDHGV
jgi:diadenosine tetraphosphatase ApaH/serine/threonine PP2A family protein phosphatase